MKGKGGMKLNCVCVCVCDLDHTYRNARRIYCALSYLPVSNGNQSETGNIRITWDFDTRTFRCVIKDTSPNELLTDRHVGVPLEFYNGN
jgi:hypothetical protein